MTGIFLFSTFYPSLGLCAQTAVAPLQTNDTDSPFMFSLLTCGPGRESYSIYGHTAIRFKNFATGEDLVVNYGIFDMSKKYFVLRFIFGLTAHTMSITTYDQFCAQYAYEGRWVKEQPLNLNGDEKQRIIEALIENDKPENRNYRYNFFYNNCTTKARDMIVSHLSGNVSYPKHNRETTLRQSIHSYSYGFPWTRLGTNLLLGVKADKPISDSEQQFLPINLMNDFNEAVVTNENGEVRQLVDSLYNIVEIQPKKVERSLFEPWFFSICIAVFLIVVTLIEKFGVKKWLWWLDALLMLVLGLCGLILTAMIFSQQYALNLNLQILVLNPLAFIGVYAALKRNPRHWFWYFYSGCILLSVVGRFFQDYAGELKILASILLVRTIVITTYKKSSNRKIVK
ncbi:MAG: DUF4105 domain-containing protein [Prevotella sp.]|nr:DUF4105 domain-containing protein [Prevotella sp.]